MRQDTPGGPVAVSTSTPLTMKLGEPRKPSRSAMSTFEIVIVWTLIPPAPMSTRAWCSSLGSCLVGTLRHNGDANFHEITVDLAWQRHPRQDGVDGGVPSARELGDKRAR